MATKSRNAKEDIENSPYAKITRNFLLSEMACTKTFDEFHEEARNGSIIAYAGDNFAIIAVDARLAVESKMAMHKIKNDLILASTGEQCATSAMASMLRARMFMNEHMRRRVMPSLCVAKLLSCLLTNKRTEKHVSYMLAGLDHLGKGAVYAYNLLGEHQRVPYRALGAASNFLQTILYKNLATELLPSREGSIARLQVSMPPTMQLESTEKLELRQLSDVEAFKLVVCAFKQAAQQSDIYTGSALIVNVINKNGCFKHEIMLKDPRASIEYWL